MKKLVCQNNSKANKFPFYGDRLSVKIIQGVKHRQTACLRKSLNRNKLPWQGDRLSGEITLNKCLKNKIVLKLAPSPQKNKHLPFIEIVVALTKKRKVFHTKQVWSGKNRIKAATCYSENSFFKSLQQQQLASCSYQRNQPLVNFLNKTCLRSDFSTQPLSNLKNLYFCKKRCTNKINPYFLLMILQSLQFILFCVRKMILY